MTQVSLQPCPHCGAGNPFGSEFCSHCGKALPRGGPGTPRVLGANDFATTAAGQKLQADELHKQAKKAAGALLTVAVIQTLVAIAIGYLFINARGARAEYAMLIPVIIATIAVIFWVLYFWARVNPLPAAIVGLILYVTLSIADYAVALAMTERQSGPGSSSSGPTVGIPWLKIIIIVILVQAIQAGSKHRKLMQQQAAA